MRSHSLSSRLLQRLGRPGSLAAVFAVSIAQGAGATAPAPSGTAAAAFSMPIPVAELGDSDSHSYHDRIWTPQGRGGPFAAATFQWTEVLTRLRGQHVDLGPWGIWGSRKRWVQALNWVGQDARAPRKEDFRYNFAVAGARCEDLMEGVFRQAPRLVDLMDEERDRWRGGIVVIRIGIVSFGMASSLDQLAADPVSSPARRTITACVSHVRAAIALIHARHPQTRIVVVGVLNNADWPPWFDHWQSAAAIANIDKGLDAFDTPLKQLAAADSRIAFFDDRAWFAGLWGSRAPDGRPADYRTVTRGLPLSVTLTQGDDPRHAVLMDGHAGLVWNALWAQSLVDLIRAKFGAPIPAISDAEVAAFVRAATAPAKP